MSIALPQTTPEHYLTGTSALQIPTEGGDFADWHFDETFLTEGARFRVVGVNYPSTQTWFGVYGIRECSSVLRAAGVALPEGAQFFAANYVRAILDLVIVGSAEHRSLSHIQAGELLHEDALITVLDWLDDLRDDIRDPTQLRLLDQWIREQQHSVST